MSFEIEQVSPVQKRIRFTVPGSEVTRKLDAAFKTLAGRVRIPGFRPGKAPRKLLEDRYGKQLRSEVATDLMNMRFQDAAKSLEFLGQPTVEHADTLGTGDFNFVIAIQVKPELEARNYTGLKIRYPLAPVTDDQVAMEITRRLSAHARLVDVEDDREVKAGDLVLTEIKDGDEVLEAGTLVNTSSERYWPGLEGHLLGMKKGATGTFNVTIDESSAVASNRGKTFAASVCILGIQEQRVPEFDDQSATLAGFEGGAEAMRAAIRMEFENRANDNGRNQARIQLLQELVKAHEVSVPDALVEKNLKLLLDELGVQATYRGRDPRSIRYSEAQLADLRSRAAFAAKAGLILESVARQEGIDVTNDDLERKYQEIADMRGQRIEAIRGYIQKDGAVNELKKHLLEERTLDWVLERCELEYVADNDGDASTTGTTTESAAASSEAAPAAEAPAAEAPAAVEAARKAKKAKKTKAEAVEAAPEPVVEAAPAEAPAADEKPKKSRSKKKAEE